MVRSKPGEEWRDLVGFEGRYRISSLGRIKTVRRKLATGSWITAALVNPRLRRDGYSDVRLTRPDGKRTPAMKIHRLVAQTFLFNRYNKKEVNHINKNRSDNRVSNLEWVTRSENMIHCHNFSKDFSYGFQSV